MIAVDGKGSGAVTLAIRPEQVRLCASADAGAMPATVTELVYFGTDTHCHLALAGGARVTARLQSQASGDVAIGVGDHVHIRASAAQVLAD
jgi:spermidine/putrescine transport system ATP-binding protein